MSRKFVTLVVLMLALVGAAAYYRYVPGRAPAGQPALANLDPAKFEQQFRVAAGEARMLVMLSPT
jgi:hypothetical protein